MVIGCFRPVLRRKADFRPAQIDGDFRKAMRVVPSLARVDDTDRARPPVVVAHAGEHHAAAARNRTRLGEMVRPYRLVTPEMRRAGPILIGCPELLQAPQRFVRVLPPRVNNATIVQQRGHEIGFAVVADQVHVAAVRVTAGQDVRVDKRPTSDVGVAPRRCEQDVPVGQVDRINVVVLAVGELSYASAIDIHLVQMEAWLVVRLEAEENSPRIERQIGSPETPGFVRRQLAELATRVQSIEYQ